MQYLAYSNIANHPNTVPKIHRHPKLTEVADASSTTNSVHIFLNVSRQVKVNDMFHVWYIKTTGGHLSQEHDTVTVNRLKQHNCSISSFA